MNQLSFFDGMKRQVDALSSVTPSPLEIAKQLAGNFFEVVPHHDDTLAFLVAPNLLAYFRGEGQMPQGECIIALYRKNLIDGGRFEDARSKPVPFKGISYYKDPADDLFAASLRTPQAQGLKRMAFTDDVAEALLATFGDALGVQVYWEQNKQRQYGIDVTISPNASLAIGLQPKMTVRPPYTQNVGWRKEHQAMQENQEKLRRNNRLVRGAASVDFIAVSNVEINPDEVQRLKKETIGHFYLQTYRVD